MPRTENKREDFKIETYEGLIHSTARRYEEQANRKGVEFDDFVQILRIRVWKAIEAYDPARSSMVLRAFVFGCVTNQVKDVLKNRTKAEALRSHHPGEVHLDDLLPVRKEEGGTGDRGADSSHNALRFLSVSEEQAYSELDEDETELPDSLTPAERTVALMLIEDYTQPLIAQHLGCRLSEVRSHISSIRLKMRPGTDLPEPALKVA